MVFFGTHDMFSSLRMVVLNLMVVALIRHWECYLDLELYSVVLQFLSLCKFHYTKIVSSLITITLSPTRIVIGFFC